MGISTKKNIPPDQADRHYKVGANYSPRAVHPKTLPSPTDPVLLRAEALDAILPFYRRDQLAAF
jgi:hypothetical protein